MDKVRKNLTDYDYERKIRTVWRCRCKVGTTASKVGFFFDKPEVGIRTEFVEERGNARSYGNIPATHVRIDEVRDDDFVFCSMM